MHTFLYATAHGKPVEKLLETCLIRLGTIPTSNNVGFIYATDALAGDLQYILMRLKNHAPQLQWVGSIGMGLCTTGQEYYDEPALALMIAAFPEGSYHLVPSLHLDPTELDDELNSWWLKQQSCVALLHGDPTNPEIPKILEKTAKSSYSSFLNGGLSSSNSQNYQIADQLVSDKLSGILFNQQVAILTDHTQGCSPIGPVHRLTETQRNVVIRLDNRPAADVLKEDIGEVLSRDLAQSAGYIFTALPIPGTDTGDYLVRNLLGIDEKNGHIAIGDYLDGQSQLMFCRRDGNSASEDMLRMLHRLHKRLGSNKVRGGIYISCLGRGRYQFGTQSEEMKMIQQVLRDFPLVGFFANGEIYNGRLYGYTGVLTLFV